MFGNMFAINILIMMTSFSGRPKVTTFLIVALDGGENMGVKRMEENTSEYESKLLEHIKAARSVQESRKGHEFKDFEWSKMDWDKISKLTTKKFSDNEIQTAILNLFLLKENSKFRERFPKIRKDPYLFSRIFKKPNETPEKYWQRIQSERTNLESPIKEDLQHFEVNTNFISIVQWDGSIPTTAILDFFDPRKNKEELIKPENVALFLQLPWLFHNPGITQFKLSAKTDNPGVLKSYERTLKIDLRMNKSDLLSEFANYLDAQEALHYVGKEVGAGSFSWDIDKTRERKESWKQLDAWQSRRQRTPFSVISRIQKVPLNTAKNRFYRAYEKIEGKEYDRNHYKSIWEILPTDLKKTCETCIDHSCLERLKEGKEWIPCPEVLGYLDQEKVSRQEKLLGEDSDFEKDFYYQKYEHLSPF